MSPYNRPPKAQKGSGIIVLLILNLSAGKGWVVSTTLRPLYPWEGRGTYFTGGWVVPRAGLDRSEKSRPPGFRSPDRSARSQSLYRVSYLAYTLYIAFVIMCGFI
jgi:hypothetical protein